MTEPHASPGHLWELILGRFLLALVVTFGGWFFVRVARRSEAPLLLIFKWIVTAIVVTLMIVFVIPMMKKGDYLAAFGGIPATAVAGLILAIAWRKNLANMIAAPFGNLFDGGTEEKELTPVYSPALAMRKRGEFRGALAAVHKELEKFPADLEGQLLMADIQAENLNDLPGSAISIERICNQAEHTPRNIALALNILADWYLKFNQDRDTARETLQRIIDRFPDSEMSNLAAQRIARLASTEYLLAPHDRKKFTVMEGVKDLGLIDPKSYSAPPDVDAAKQAAELVTHLQAHPLDAEARENLAVIYADHYGRMDLTIDQLEQLITHPNESQKRVVHWLNLLADLQLRHGANYETARATLQRILDLYPGAPSAELAAKRIALLKLEVKGKEKVSEVKLGIYEQDIGLKMGGGKGLPG